MMQFMDIQHTFPILEILQLIPFVASLILWRIRNTPAAIIAIFTVIVEMIVAIILFQQFDVDLERMQFATKLSSGIPYHAAVDGISVSFILMTALLGLLSVLFVIFRKLHNTGVLGTVLLIQAILMSQFITVNLLWFVLMSILEIISIGYLLYRWATFVDPEPMIYSYAKFMSISIILMLLGTLLLGWNYSDQSNMQLALNVLNTSTVPWSFDLFDLQKTPITGNISFFIFFCLFYGFGIRIPVFPLHGWLPITMQHGNVSVAPVLLLGLKVGVYGLIRFVFPLLPEAINEWNELVMVFALVGIFYAAVLAMRQTNLRRLMAYGVISHTGILTIGLFSLSQNGFKGSLMLAINFGLAISGLMFMIGLLWERTNTAVLSRLGGMIEYIPVVGAAFLIAGLAIVGMPGTPGFDAVHYVLEASIKEFGALVTIAAALGNVTAAGFLLFAFQKVFLSKPQCDTIRWNKSKANFTEMTMTVIVIVVILGMGFFSSVWEELFKYPLTLLDALYPDSHLHKGGS